MTAVPSVMQTSEIHTSNGHGYGSTSTSSTATQPAAVVGPPAFAQDVFKHLTLYTGNIMRTGTTGSQNTSLKKSNQELVSAMEETLEYSIHNARMKGNAITITDETSLEPLDGDRAQYEITVKMFYMGSQGSTRTPLSVDQLNAAIQDLETNLGIPEIKIDLFILSLPNQVFDESDLDESELAAFTKDVQELLMPVWTRLSELQRGGRIGRLGVAEFSKQQLEAIKAVATAHNAAAPEVNQVNLQDCCVLPSRLIDYAKQQGIELLTHGDSAQILPQSTFSAMLKPYLPATIASGMAPNFVLKFSCFITCRGLVTRKGYVVDAGSN